MHLIQAKALWYSYLKGFQVARTAQLGSHLCKGYMSPFSRKPLWAQAQASVLQKRSGGLSRVLPAHPPRPVCAPCGRSARPAGPAGLWALACSIRMEAEPPPSAWPRPPKKPEQDPEQVKEARPRPASRGRRGPCRNKGSRPGAGKWGRRPGSRGAGLHPAPSATAVQARPRPAGLTLGSPGPREGTGGGDLVSFPRWFPRAARSGASVPRSPTGFPAAQRGRPGGCEAGTPGPRGHGRRGLRRPGGQVLLPAPPAPRPLPAVTSFRGRAEQPAFRARDLAGFCVCTRSAGGLVLRGVSAFISGTGHPPPSRPPPPSRVTLARRHVALGAGFPPRTR